MTLNSNTPAPAQSEQAAISATQSTNSPPPVRWVQWREGNAFIEKAALRREFGGIAGEILHHIIFQYEPEVIERHGKSPQLKPKLRHQGDEGYWWTYKSHEDFDREIGGISADQLDRAIKTLKDKGIIEVTLRRVRSKGNRWGAPTRHFRLLCAGGAGYLNQRPQFGRWKDGVAGSEAIFPSYITDTRKAKSEEYGPDLDSAYSGNPALPQNPESSITVKPGIQHSAYFGNANTKNTYNDSQTKNTDKEPSAFPTKAGRTNPGKVASLPGDTPAAHQGNSPDMGLGSSARAAPPKKWTGMLDKYGIKPPENSESTAIA